MSYEDDNGNNGNGDPDSYATTETHLGDYEATQRVNVREAPSMTAPIVRVLEVGDRVPVAAIEAGWAKLATPGTELVKADYLKEQA